LTPVSVLLRRASRKLMVPGKTFQGCRVSEDDLTKGRPANGCRRTPPRHNRRRGCRATGRCCPIGITRSELRYGAQVGELKNRPVPKVRRTAVFGGGCGYDRSAPYEKGKRVSRYRFCCRYHRAPRRLAVKRRREGGSDAADSNPKLDAGVGTRNKKKPAPYREQILTSSTALP